MSDFIYLYGFVPADASPPGNLAGIAGRNVTLHGAGAISAAVSRVPADEYDPARIDARLQDLEWVAEQGVAHEGVVAWFVDHAEILPVSLFTMYSGMEALETAIAARAESLAAEMARFRNKREWDLKISFDEGRVAKHAAHVSSRIAEIDAEVAAAAPGRRYLLEKKRGDVLKTELRAAATSLANEALDAARSLAVDVRTLPIPRTQELLPVVLHAALLVERSAEKQFRDTLEREGLRLERLGVTLRFSGPWAPYRFTGDHERDTAGNG